MRFVHGFWLLMALPWAVAAQPALLDQRTTIDSDELEMQGTDERNYFYFRGNVHVLGNDLEIMCEELTVTAHRGGHETDTVGEVGAIERIVATGGVEIDQAGRQAFAGRVEVDPTHGTITFLDQPVIVQGDVRATAYGFVFHTREKRLEAIPAPEGTGPRRSTISLPSLPQMTFNLDEEEITVDERINIEAAPDDDDADPTENASEGSIEPGEEAVEE